MAPKLGARPDGVKHLSGLHLGASSAGPSTLGDALHEARKEAASVVRSGCEPADGTGRYDVQRPDGSYCCRGVLWGDVEDQVLADLRKNAPIDHGAASSGVPHNLT